MTLEANATTPLVRRPMRADEGDLALFQACFARNNDHPRSMAALRWQYREGVTGKTFVDFAVTGQGEAERVAAIYATMPGYLRIAGQRRLGLQSVDTLTDADFRGRGLFVSLAQETYRRAAEDGAALVYGFPNGSSAHGFFKKLGWSSLDPVPMLLRPLRSAYFAAKAPARFRWLASRLPDVPLHLPLPLPTLGGEVAELGESDLDERASALWTEFSAGIGVGIERDAAYLRWRLFQKPGERYTVRALVRDGRFEALVAFVVKEKHGGRIGYVMELLHRPGRAAAAALLLHGAVSAMARAGADAVLAWCFSHSPSFRAYAVNAFVPLPERARPIELHAGVCAFDPAIADAMKARTSWYLSYLDSDTV